MTPMIHMYKDQCLGPVDPLTQIMIIFHSVLSIFVRYMTLMIPVYKYHIPMSGSSRLFLSLICVCGSIGPKFKFTAKNIASGFFSDMHSEI